jgi:AAA family ATP:ADP antiporter
MIGLYNFVNSTGEFIMTAVTVQTELSKEAPKPPEVNAPKPIPSLEERARVRPALQEERSAADMEKSIHRAFMNYQLLTNLIALVIQLFLVSRIFRWIGVGGALFFLPLIALGGYALISFGAVLVLVRWVKSLENGTDYSLQSTTKAALFLVTPREEKYKAKAAIDTFFVRGGDTVSALAVLVGTRLLGLKIERYALLNVVVVIILVAICFKIIQEYKKRKAASDGIAGAA